MSCPFGFKSQDGSNPHQQAAEAGKGKEKSAKKSACPAMSNDEQEVTTNLC